MANGLYLGDSRRRRGRGGGEGFLLVIAIVVALFSFYWYAPSSGGSWEAAATQISKKSPSLVLFYPAWERDVLHRLRNMPILMLDGPAHLELAGFHTALFASDEAAPEAVVQNLFALQEIRDFAGKAVSVLKVADLALTTDFAKLDVALEDPPGMQSCARDGERFDCHDKEIALALRTVEIQRAPTRCVYAKSARPVIIRIINREQLKVRKGRLFLARLGEDTAGAASQPVVSSPAPASRPGSTPAERPPATAGVERSSASTAAERSAASTVIEVRVDDRRSFTLKGERPGVWQTADLPIGIGMSSIELAVMSHDGACLDLELLQ